MNIIDTSNIIDPNQAQPYFGLSLEFHQAATKEALNNIAQGLIGAQYSSGVIFVLWGCIRTGAADGAGSGVAAVSAGAIFYNGEVYTVPAFSTTNIAGQTLYSSLIVTQASFDPSQFSNGASFNVHNIRQWNIVQANSGSFPQSGWVNLWGTWNYIGDPGQPVFTSGTFVNVNSGTNRLRFKLIDGGLNLMISGYIKTASSSDISVETNIFTLPTAYRPLSERIVTASGNGTGGHAVCFVRFSAAGVVSVLPYDPLVSFFLTGIIIPLD